MKFSVSVLLLLCCVAVKSDKDVTELHYRDEQTENEIQSEAEKGAETSACIELICKLDILTLLRELSQKLAEQTVELRYTKYQIEEQMEELKKQNEAAEIRLKASETQLEELKREYGGQALELRTLQMRSNITEGQVRELRKENTYKIAFSASISARSPIFIGPFSTAITLKYTNVYVNNGNAYNPNTGIFTAPVRGVYTFHFSITGPGSPSNAVGAWLFKNNEVMLVAYVQQPSDFVSSTNGASLLLEVGDVVYVLLIPNTHISDDQDHYNTFSGQLLFTV